VRLHAPSNRGTIWLGLILVGSLLLAPVTWASGEDVREQGQAAKAEKSEKDEGAKAKPGKDDASETALGDSPESGEKAAPDPSFNTIEDVQACLGPVEALWSRAPRPAPEVTWREID
jgi:hypothetical protein